MSGPSRGGWPKHQSTAKIEKFLDGTEDTKDQRKLCQSSFSVPKVNAPPATVFEKTLPDQQPRQVLKRTRQSSIVSRATVTQTGSNFYKPSDETTVASRAGDPNSPRNKTATDFGLTGKIARIKNFSLTATGFGPHAAKNSIYEPEATTQGGENPITIKDAHSPKSTKPLTAAAVSKKKRTLTGEGLSSKDSQSKFHTLGALFGMSKMETSLPAKSNFERKEKFSKNSGEKPKELDHHHQKMTSESSYLEDWEPKTIPACSNAAADKPTQPVIHPVSIGTNQRPFWYSESLAKLKANRTFQKKSSAPGIKKQPVTGKRIQSIPDSVSSLPEKDVDVNLSPVPQYQNKPYKLARMSVKGNTSVVSLRSVNHMMSYPKLDLLEHVMSVSKTGASSEMISSGNFPPAKDMKSLYSTTQPNAPMPSLNLDYFRNDLSGQYREFLLVLNHQCQLSRTVDLQLTQADSNHYTKFNKASQLVALARKFNPTDEEIIQVFASESAKMKLEQEELLEMLRSGAFKLTAKSDVQDRHLTQKVKKEFDRAKIENLVSAAYSNHPSGLGKSGFRSQIVNPKEVAYEEPKRFDAKKDWRCSRSKTRIMTLQQSSSVKDALGVQPIENSEFRMRNLTKNPAHTSIVEQSVRHELALMSPRVGSRVSLNGETGATATTEEQKEIILRRYLQEKSDIDQQAARLAQAKANKTVQEKAPTSQNSKKEQLKPPASKFPLNFSLAITSSNDNLDVRSELASQRRKQPADEDPINLKFLGIDVASISLFKGAQNQLFEVQQEAAPKSSAKRVTQFCQGMVRLLRKIEGLHLTINEFCSRGLFPKVGGPRDPDFEKFLLLVKQDQLDRAYQMLAVNKYLVYEVDAVDYLSNLRLG